jgi:lipid II:glycine glycyltransferase (peptidoglycan interpeptide bridge formation enzyme)
MSKLAAARQMEGDPPAPVADQPFLSRSPAAGHSAGRQTIWPRFGESPGAAERAWESFVAQADGGDVVQSAAWGRSKDAMGFRVAIAVCHEPDGGILGGGLVVAKRLTLLGGRLPLVTVGYVARGPLVASEDPARVTRVLDAIEATARELGVAHLVVQPPAGGEAIATALAARGYAAGAMPVAPTCTLVIDLAPDVDTLFAGLSSSQRRNLRKARKLGVQVRSGDHGDLRAFHALHAATAERHGFRPLSLAYLERQWQALRPLGAIELFLAAAPDASDRPIAGEMVTAYGGTVTTKVTGWNGEVPTLQPTATCIWEAITWAKAAGYRRFDLGGLDPAAGQLLLAGEREREALGERNPAAFKARFGGSVHMMPEAAQRTFNPVLGAAFRVVWRQLAASPHLKRFLNGLRNG